MVEGEIKKNTKEINDWEERVKKHSLIGWGWICLESVVDLTPLLPDGHICPDTKNIMSNGNNKPKLPLKASKILARGLLINTDPAFLTCYIVQSSLIV